MAFRQAVVLTGGYRSCPAVQGGPTVTTALTPQPPFFCSSDSSIHTSGYSLLFACVSFFLTSSRSSAVGKVSKSRRGHPLVLSEIVNKDQIGSV